MTPDEARAIAIRACRCQAEYASDCMGGEKTQRDYTEAAAVLEAQANVEEECEDCWPESRCDRHWSLLKVPQANVEEKRICERRGHQPGPNAVSDNFYTWHFCKWCGTQYGREICRWTPSKAQLESIAQEAETTIEEAT